MVDDLDAMALKPGDEVAVSTGGFGLPQIRRVERVTKTQIIIEGGYYRYRRQDGRALGGWRRGCLLPVTKDLLDEIERNRLRRIVDDINPRDLTTEQLRAIVDLVTPAPPTQPTAAMPQESV